jgi:hypothetical protein
LEPDVTVPRDNVSPHERKLKKRKTATPAVTAPQRHSDRGSGDDEDAADFYLPTPRVAERYDVSTRTVERWGGKEELNFPAPDLVVHTRKYWRLRTLEAWERSMLPRGDKERRHEAGPA